MRRLLLLLFMLLARPSYGVIAHISSASDGDTSGTVTTDGQSTVGATLIVVQASWSNASTPTLSDNQTGNTYNARTIYTTGSNKSCLYWCVPVDTDAAHTFTFALANSYPSLHVMAFSGTHASAPYDTENGQAIFGGTTNQPGPLTPNANNCVVVTGIMQDTATDPSIDGGYTEVSSANSSGNYVGGGIAYLIQTTATATDPTWTVGSSNNCAGIASFFEAASNPVPVIIHRLRLCRVSPWQRFINNTPILMVSK